MELIKTKDNQQSVNLRERLGSEVFEAHLPNLLKLSEHAIRDIKLEEHPNLLFFPHDFKTYGDEIGMEKIFELDGDCMATGNIMGFVGYNGTQISIHSRFAEDGGKDYFLHYMLQKVLCLNIFNLDFQSDRENIFDFLIYLFPGFLKEAMRQGTYREYQIRKYNDANIKGRIDVARHIRHNSPFTGNVAYSTREYVSDNHVTQLIRHAIEYIKQHPMGGDILNSDDKTKEAVSIINASTPTYNRMERQKIISQNLRPLSHPYYFAYRDLQRLCMRILRHEEMKYGVDDNQIHGILFDGAWLWEEYLNTFLKELHFTHPRNKTDNIGKKMFEDPKKVLMQPDFYKNDMVLDAKYKKHEGLFDDKLREDRFQLLAYMYVFKARKSGLIVPIESRAEKVTHGTIDGYKGDMYLWGMPVDGYSVNFQSYRRYMEEQEVILVEKIKEI